MTEAHRNTVESLLIHDALEAEQGKNGPAAILLVDAAISILLSSLNGSGAREMALMIAEYVPAQVEFVLGKRGGA